MTTEITVPVRILVLKDSIADLLNLLSHLDVNSNSFKTLNKYILSMTLEMTRFEAMTSRSFGSLNLFNKANKSVEKMEDTLAKARIAMNDIKFPDLKLSNSLLKEWDSLNEALDNATKKFDAVKERMKHQILGDAETSRLFENIDPKAMDKSYDLLFSLIENRTQKVGKKLAESKDKLDDFLIKKNSAHQRGSLLASEGFTPESLGDAAFNKFFTKAANGALLFKNIPGQEKGAAHKAFVDFLKSEYSLGDKETNELLKYTTAPTLNNYVKKLGKQSNMFTRGWDAANFDQLHTLEQQVKDVEAAYNKYQEVMNKFTDASFTGDLTKAAGEVGEAYNKLLQELSKLDSLMTTFKENALKGFKLGDILQSFSAYLNELNNFKNTLATTNAEFLKLEQTKRTFSNMKMAISNFMGFYLVLNLTKRGVKEAMTHIKELDSVMNKISIVTDKSTSDLWGLVDAYSDMAQKYGVSIKGAYEVSLIYYQQGLDTSDVLTLTNETLKLSKISGLDYATTTDYMTTAMRGFKMETSDASRVVDVYSNLAAHTAVSLGELAVGMSKTASSLESVGASFEESSAMIATMVAVTRESSTNIGSAMKSIASRYGEMKKDMSAAFDAEGEELSYNKVDAALQSVGISLKDSSGQFRNMTDVIIELGEQWDTLDSVQQRYIATQFAGNRQQSRFLALVSNVDLLKSNLNYALDSENVGDVLALKALDSIESRTEQLKVAYQLMYTTIGAEDMWKGALSGLTNFMNTLNGMPKLFDKIPIGAAAMLYDVVNVIRSVGNKALEGVSSGILSGLMNDKDLAQLAASFMSRVNLNLEEELKKQEPKTKEIGAKTANTMSEGAKDALKDENLPAAKPLELEKVSEPAKLEALEAIKKEEIKAVIEQPTQVPVELVPNKEPLVEATKEATELGMQEALVPLETSGAIADLLKDLEVTSQLAELTKEVKVDVTANIAPAEAAIQSLDGKTVTVNVNANTPDLAVSGGRFGNGAPGGAYAAGTKKLLGELGPEMYVTNGHYYVAGTNGPEMIDLPDDAIVFNHLLTENLLKKNLTGTNGKPITTERKAVAMAGGNFDIDALRELIISVLLQKLINSIGENPELIIPSSEMLGYLAKRHRVATRVPDLFEDSSFGEAVVKLAENALKNGISDDFNEQFTKAIVSSLESGEISGQRVLSNLKTTLHDREQSLLADKLYLEKHPDNTYEAKRLENKQTRLENDKAWFDLVFGNIEIPKDSHKRYEARLDAYLEEYTKALHAKQDRKLELGRIDAAVTRSKAEPVYGLSYRDAQIEDVLNKPTRVDPLHSDPSSFIKLLASPIDSANLPKTRSWQELLASFVDELQKLNEAKLEEQKIDLAITQLSNTVDNSTEATILKWQRLNEIRQELAETTDTEKAKNLSSERLKVAKELGTSWNVGENTVNLRILELKNALQVTEETKKALENLNDARNEEQLVASSNKPAELLKVEGEAAEETNKLINNVTESIQESVETTTSIKDLGASLGEVFDLTSGEAMDTAGIDNLLSSLLLMGTITEELKNNLSLMFATEPAEKFIEAYNEITKTNGAIADANKEMEIPSIKYDTPQLLLMDFDNLGPDNTVMTPLLIDSDLTTENISETVELVLGQLAMDFKPIDIKFNWPEEELNENITKTENKLDKLKLTFSSLVLWKGNTGLGSKLSLWGSGINMLTGMIKTDTRENEIVKGGIMTGAGVIKTIGGIASGSPMALATGVMSVINGINTIIEDNEEKLLRLTKTAEELDNKAKLEKANYKTLESSIEKINELEDKRYESEEAAEEYLATVDKLTEKFPDLISGFDEFGNAIVDMSTAEDALANARSKSVNATYAALEAEEERLLQERDNTITTAKSLLNKIPDLFETAYSLAMFKQGLGFKEKISGSSAGATSLSSGMSALSSPLTEGYAWGENTVSRENMLKSMAWYAAEEDIGVLLDKDNANVIATKLILQKIKAKEGAVLKNAEGDITGLDTNKVLEAIADLHTVEAEQLKIALTQEELAVSITPEEVENKVAQLSEAIDSLDINLINQAYEEINPLMSLIRSLTPSEDEPLFLSILDLETLWGKVNSLILDQKTLGANQVANAKGLVNAYVLTLHLTDDFILEESGLLAILSNNFASAYIKQYQDAVANGKTFTWNLFKTSNALAIDEAAGAMNNFWIDLVNHGEETSLKFVSMLKNLEDYRLSDFNVLNLENIQDWDFVNQEIGKQFTERISKIRLNLSKYFSLNAAKTSGLNESSWYSEWLSAADKVETYSEGLYLKTILDLQTSLYEGGFTSDAADFGEAALSVFNDILKLEDPAVRNALWKSIDKNKLKTKEGIDKIIKDIDASESTADDILKPMLESMRNLLQDSMALGLESTKEDFIEKWDDGSKLLKSLTSGIDLKEVDNLLTSDAGKAMGLTMSNFTLNGDNLVLQEQDALKYIDQYFASVNATMKDRSEQLQRISETFGQFDKEGNFTVNKELLTKGYKLTEYDKKDLNALLRTDEYKKYIDEDGTLKEDTLDDFYTAIQDRLKLVSDALLSLGLYTDAAKAAVKKSYEWSKGDYSSLQETFSKLGVEDYTSRLKELAGGARYKNWELDEPDIKNAVDKMTDGYSSFLSDVLEKGTENINIKQYEGILQEDASRIANQLSADMDVSDFVSQYYQAAGWTIEEANSKIIEANRKAREKSYDEVKELGNISKAGQLLDLTYTTLQLDKEYLKNLKAKQKELNFAKHIRSNSTIGANYTKKLEEELLELTQNNPIEQLANKLKEAGAILENGILTLTSKANMSAIADALAEASKQVGSGMAAELMDMAQDILKKYIDYINNGIEGKATYTEATDLMRYAKANGAILEEDAFYQAADGLKLSNDAAIQLYSTLDNVSAVLKSIVFDSLTKLLKENNKHYKSTASILARIGKLNEQIKNITDETDEAHLKLQKTLEAERDIARLMAANNYAAANDSWDFSNGGFTKGAITNVATYYSTWARYMLSMGQWASTGRIDYTGFTDLIAHVSLMAQAIGDNINFMGKTFTKEGLIGTQTLDALLRSLFSALRADKNGAYYDKSVLSSLGFNITKGDTAMSGMYDFIDLYLGQSDKDIEAWNEIMEAFMGIDDAMKASTDHNTIESFFNGDILDLEAFTSFIDKNGLGDKWKAFADNFYIGNEKLSDIINNSSIFEKDAETYSNAMKGIFKMLLDEEGWDVGNQLQSMALLMERFGLEDGSYKYNDKTIHVKKGKVLIQVDDEEGGSEYTDSNGNTVSATSPEEAINKLNKALAEDFRKLGKEFGANIADVGDKGKGGYDITLSGGQKITVRYKGDNTVEVVGADGKPYDNIQAALDQAYKEFGEGMEKSEWYQSEGFQLDLDSTGQSIFLAFTGLSGEIIGKTFGEAIKSAMLLDNGEPITIPVEVDPASLANLSNPENPITIPVKIDPNLFNTDIGNMEKPKPVEITVTAQVTQALTDINGVKRAEPVNITADAQVETAQSDINGILRENPVDVTTLADIEPAKTAIDGITPAGPVIVKVKLEVDDTDLNKFEIESNEGGIVTFKAPEELGPAPGAIPPDEVTTHTVEENVVIGDVEELPDLTAEGTVNYTNSVTPLEPQTATGTVYWTHESVNSPPTGGEGPTGAKGKGNHGFATGNAHAKSTLMGELGPEMVVSNGRYFVVGQNGPEFVDLNKDAIVFNHLQTRSLLEKGTSNTRGRAITNERNAVAYAKGSRHGGIAREGGKKETVPTSKDRPKTKDALKGKGGNGEADAIEGLIKALDKWYNLLQELAKILAKLNKEEALRAKIQSDLNKSGKEYYESLKRSIEQLKKEVETSKLLVEELKAEREKRTKELKRAPFGKMYETDEDGQVKMKTKFKKEYDKYFDDTDTGKPKKTVKQQYDWLKKQFGAKALEYDSNGKQIKLTGEKEKDLAAMKTAVEAALKRMEAQKDEIQGLTDSINEHEKSMLEAQEKENELLQAMRDNLLTVEDSVLNAIISSREREIEDQLELRDAIEESTNKFIDGLSNALNKEREMYNMEEEESNLRSKLRRLAVLQRTGGSGSEIASLESEIESEQRDLYFDKQQEQIDAIQEASDKEIERLDMEIDLMQTQLDYEKEHGLLWDEVYEVMNKSAEEIANFIQVNDSDWWGKSAIATLKDLADAIFNSEQWVAYRDEGKDKQEEESGTDTGTEDKETTKVKGDKKAGDKTKYQVTYKDSKGKTKTKYFDTKKEAKEFLKLHEGSELSKYKKPKDTGTTGTKTGVPSETGTGSTLSEDEKRRILEELLKRLAADLLKLKAEAEAAQKKAKEEELRKKKLEQLEKKLKTQTPKTKTLQWADDLLETEGMKLLQSLTGSLLGSRANGGYTNHGIYELGEKGTEAVLTAEQTSVLRNKILANKPNSLINLLADFLATADKMANGSTYNSIDRSAATSIGSMAVNMNVKEIANDYDAKRAGELAMEEMLRIARKTNVTSLRR